MSIPAIRTIKYSVMKNDVKLSLRINCEGIYFVFYGDQMLGNMKDYEDAEELFLLAKNGYDKEVRTLKDKEI